MQILRENAIVSFFINDRFCYEKGTINALSKGSTYVVVSLEGANNAIFTVNVELHDLEFSQKQFDLFVEEIDNITIKCDGKDVTKDVTYTVENEDIATVEKGNITAKIKEGQTDVTVSLVGINRRLEEMSLFMMFLL